MTHYVHNRSNLSRLCRLAKNFVRSVQVIILSRIWTVRERALSGSFRSRLLGSSCGSA